MSFSATILFTAPGRAEVTQEAGAGESQGPATVTVGGQGVAVNSTEQLLHLIYQRLQTAASAAEEALAIARANQQILRGLQLEVSRLAKVTDEAREPIPSPDKVPASPEDVKARLEIVTQPEELLEIRAVTPPNSQVHTDTTSAQNNVCDSYSTVSSPHGRIVSSPSCRQPPVCPDPHTPSESQPELYAEASQGSEDSTGSNLMMIEDILHSSFTGVHTAPPAYTVPSRCGGLKNSRRKRDVVLSKMVHNIHNHVSNDKRFNGSESIKSSWNIGVVKYLVERLKSQLTHSSHHYTDKELKGAFVAYFLTKRREYRNAMNPYKSLKEREDKKLRSRRYRLFGARSAIVRLFGPEDQRLWETASEEFMSDEEDSTLEPGVWVARSPRFRSAELSDLCRRLDANSKHGLRPNRVPGPPSDRLPSSDLGLFPPPPRLLCHRLGEGEGEEVQPHPFVEVKVEKDD
ncbi:uncharacterized protein C14orf93-like isoform X1 [Heterodontus francisci]|uniref:uncharacterized protein C14orf93-like isoform X1 n=1 Tax=Heterodontus francisci TaxID=7792 RepID=UPI00355AEA9E